MQTGDDPRHTSHEAVNGILRILRINAQWVDLPERYTLYQMCQWRYLHSRARGQFERIIEATAVEPKEHGNIDLTECFIACTLVAAIKRLNM